MIEHGLAGQLAAITYDPGFDLPPRLAAYGRARGLTVRSSVRMFRAVEGHSRLAEFFGLRVGYTGIDRQPAWSRAVSRRSGSAGRADLGAHSLGNSRCSRCPPGRPMTMPFPSPTGRRNAGRRSFPAPVAFSPFRCETRGIRRNLVALLPFRRETWVGPRVHGTVPHRPAIDPSSPPASFANAFWLALRPGPNPKRNHHGHDQPKPPRTSPAASMRPRAASASSTRS